MIVNNQQLIDSFVKLKHYCEAELYKGWDPYDGLNSKVFQTLPFLKKSAVCRLAVIQFFKRCPINFRRIALVPKEYNAKGIALFLQGYCNLVKVVSKNSEYESALGKKEELFTRVNELAELLISLQSKGNYHGACWGYNFDWQARKLFLFPKGTPTVVATTFCVSALLDAYEVMEQEKCTNYEHEKWKDIALSSAEFVLHDLHRHPCRRGFLFSYSPLQGNDTVYNASLLGSKLLSLCYHYTSKQEYFDAAHQSVMACCDAQQTDGSWVYGMLPVQSWIDSFHTGYNLEALNVYEEMTGDTTFHTYIEKGFEFYIKNFFEEDGCPKYYHNKKFPIDIHCSGEFFVTLSRLHKSKKYTVVAEKVLNWTISNMQGEKGYFYYQKKKWLTTRIPYMRWSNAFMFCALTEYARKKF